MNGTDIALRISSELGISREMGRQAVDIVRASIQESVGSREDAMILGIGVWRTRVAKARKTRNPANGEEMTIPATRRVSFKPSQILKDIAAWGYTEGLTRSSKRRRVA